LRTCRSTTTASQTLMSGKEYVVDLVMARIDRFALTQHERSLDAPLRAGLERDFSFNRGQDQGSSRTAAALSCLVMRLCKSAGMSKEVRTVRFIGS